MKMKWLGLSQAIHPADKKGTAGLAIKPLSGFSRVTIPLDMQVGPGCESIVKKGDHVDIGDPLGKPLGAWSVPVHASVSGEVESVQEQILSDGSRAQYVTIVSDGKDTVSELVKKPVVTDHASFIEAIRVSGLVGLGGAAFPTHIKLNPPPDKKVDTLIVNAAECEPYITTDNRICLENAYECVAGALATAFWCGIENVVFGIEDNKKDAAVALKKAAKRAKRDGRGSVEIKVLPTSYPTGAEKVLIRLINGRIVPEGGLPADVGVIVQNVTTIWFIARYLRTGMPLVKKWITLDGGCLLYTSLK